MCQKSGTLLLAAVFIGLGVMNCAYPTLILQKTLTFYGTFVPILATLKLNIISGVGMILTATALVLQKSHAACLVQLFIILSIIIQGNPYVPTLVLSEQFEALFSLMKFIGILGGSLLIAK